MANPTLIDRGGLSPDLPPTPAGTPGLIPIEYSRQIIQQAIEQSMALSTFRRVTMPAQATVMPVLDALPVARFVTGEPNSTDASGGLKPVTSQAWKGVNLIAEEIATIVVIPEAVIEDASIDIWSEVTPRLAESVAAAIDGAVFSGTNKPASWPDDIITAATAAGNVAAGAAAQPDQDDFNEAVGYVEDDGFMPKQVYARINVRSAFRGWTVQGVPVYLTDFRDDGRVDSVYGLPVQYDRFGAIQNAAAVVGDPNMAIMGIRTDLQYKVLDQATLDVSAAGDGSEMVSLAQQDLIALRVRGRFGFAVANPVTYLNTDSASRFPFAVVTTT